MRGGGDHCSLNCFEREGFFPLSESQSEGEHSNAFLFYDNVNQN